MNFMCVCKTYEVGFLLKNNRSYYFTVLFLRGNLIMKKRIGLLFLLLNIGFHSFALDFSAGIKGGFGLFDLNRKIGFFAVDIPKEKSLKGESFLRGRVGLYFELGLLKWLALQQEIYFAPYTAVIFERSNYKLSWSSLDFDLLLKGRFKYLYLITGPVLHVALGNVRVKSDEHKLPDEFKNDPYDDFVLKRLIWGWTFGLGTEVPLGPGVFSLGVRTNLTITPSISDSVDVKYRELLAFDVGYGFRF
jgi:hypothetical protein